MTRQSWCAALVAAAFIVGSARAALTGITSIDATLDSSPLPRRSVPAGFIAWRVYVTATSPLDVLLGVEDADWTFSANLFQHPDGGDMPSAAGADPTRAADSFVTLDAFMPPHDTVLDASFLPPFNGPGGSPPQGGFSGPGNTVRGGWFDGNPVTGAAAGADGRLLIAQLTLPVGARGGGSVTAEQVCDLVNCFVPLNLQILPGPPAAALLILGARGRRRRRDCSGP